MMQNQLEKKMEDEMEAWFVRGLKGIIDKAYCDNMILSLIPCTHVACGKQK